MKYWNLNKINRLAFDKIGPIPKSISKVFDKFQRELDPNSEIEALEEFKISQYQTVASIKYLVLLLVAPIIINQTSKSLIIGPCIDYIWNQKQFNLFLNESQEERAFAELQRFEEKLHFEILIGQITDSSYNLINEKITIKALELAKQYANESANAIKNMISDIFSIAIFFALLKSNKRQVSILKSFVNELIYSLSDTAKAFIIILFTDMFVGFHSPHGWEVIIEVILKRFGLPESRSFIFIFISTFPVVLDTIFKYWIFRYLNRISPSAVATYHNMNE